MMRAVFFWLFVALFVMHQAGLFSASGLAPLLDGYLDPALLMPILLYLVSVEQRVLFNAPSGAALPNGSIFRLTVSVSFICELIFPLMSSKFTDDLLDILCYFGGSAFYAAFMNKRGRQPGRCT